MANEKRAPLHKQLPARRGYYWNGRRWASIRGRYATHIGLLVSLILLSAIAMGVLIVKFLT